MGGSVRTKASYAVIYLGQVEVLQGSGQNGDLGGFLVDHVVVSVVTGHSEGQDGAVGSAVDTGVTAPQVDREIEVILGKNIGVLLVAILLAEGGLAVVGKGGLEVVQHLSGNGGLDGLQIGEGVVIVTGISVRDDGVVVDACARNVLQVDGNGEAIVTLRAHGGGCLNGELVGAVVDLGDLGDVQRSAKNDELLLYAVAGVGVGLVNRNHDLVHARVGGTTVELGLAAVVGEVLGTHTIEEHVGLGNGLCVVGLGDVRDGQIRGKLIGLEVIGGGDGAAGAGLVVLSLGGGGSGGLQGVAVGQLKGEAVVGLVLLVAAREALVPVRGLADRQRRLVDVLGLAGSGADVTSGIAVVVVDVGGHGTIALANVTLGIAGIVIDVGLCGTVSLTNVTIDVAGVVVNVGLRSALGVTDVALGVAGVIVDVGIYGALGVTDVTGGVAGVVVGVGGYGTLGATLVTGGVAGVVVDVGDHGALTAADVTVDVAGVVVLMDVQGALGTANVTGGVTDVVVDMLHLVACVLALFLLADVPVVGLVVEPAADGGVILNGLVGAGGHTQTKQQGRQREAYDSHVFHNVSPFLNGWIRRGLCAPV